MGEHHVLRIKKDYFNLINKGLKSLEVRVGYSQIKLLKDGDTLSFENYVKNCFKIVRITKYVKFAEMLDIENSQFIIPGKTKYEAIQMLEKIYPKNKERLGVYVIELEKYHDVKNDIEIIAASVLAEQNRIAFSEIISKAYEITDYICKDYPKHFKWYWEKTIPAIFTGKREILVCTVNKKIAGVAFLKKEDGEKKICTFLVLDEYKGQGIASKLIERAFDFLETTTPLITLTDYKWEMFKGIIIKYNWKHTQTLPKGYYNNLYEELVFNGKIE